MRQWHAGGNHLYSRACIFFLLLLDVFAGIITYALLLIFMPAFQLSAGTSAFMLQATLLWVAVSRIAGVYSPLLYRHFYGLFRILLANALTVTVLLVGLARLQNISWTSLQSLWPVFLFFLGNGLLLRSLMMGIYYLYQQQRQQRVLIVGEGSGARVLREYLLTSQPTALQLDCYPMTHYHHHSQQWLDHLMAYCIRHNVQKIYLAEALEPGMVARLRKRADEQFIYFHQVGPYVAGSGQQSMPRLLTDDILLYHYQLKPRRPKLGRWLPRPPAASVGDMGRPQLQDR